MFPKVKSRSKHGINGVSSKNVYKIYLQPRLLWRFFPIFHITKSIIVISWSSFPIRPYLQVSQANKDRTKKVHTHHCFNNTNFITKRVVVLCREYNHQCLVAIWYHFFIYVPNTWYICCIALPSTTLAIKHKQDHLNRYGI